MTRDTLPTYAVIELLIRLGNIDPHIGNYNDRVVYTTVVVVKTTNGHITFTKTFIKQQFDCPELILEEDLKQLATAFKPALNR